MNKILYLPLDERPCNEAFLKRLIKICSDIELITPKKEILGNKKLPSDYSKIKDFLLNQALDCDYAVIALDQLLYGGIIPSRLHHLAFDELITRLKVLNELKIVNPKIKIYAFSLIMRCPKYSSSDEEPDYYEICGEEIHQYGVYLHKKESIPNTIKDKVEPYLNDYLTRRKINKEMIFKILDATKDTIDYLVIPQDDSSPYGFTTMDRNEILDYIKKYNYQVIIYPGADEVGLTLTARAISVINQKQTKFYLNFLSDEVKKLIPAYENKPLYETINNQIEASNSLIVDNINDADIILCLNYNSDKEEESANYQNVLLPNDLFIKQINFIKECLDNHKKVSLVDKFFVNGGCVDYLKRLLANINFFDLSGYGGWNTSSNTLGTVIAESIINNLYDNADIKNQFMAERIYDDASYQARIRKEITNNVLPKYGFNYFDIGTSNGVISKIITEELNKFVKENYPSVFNQFQINNLTNPWKRMFEIDVEVIKK